MSETNKDVLANINALIELDKNRFRTLAIDVREARRRAEDLLDRIVSIREGFLMEEMAKDAALQSVPAEEEAAAEVQAEETAEITEAVVEEVPNVSSEESAQRDASSEPEKRPESPV